MKRAEPNNDIEAPTRIGIEVDMVQLGNSPEPQSLPDDEGELFLDMPSGQLQMDEDTRKALEEIARSGKPGKMRLTFKTNKA